MVRQYTMPKTKRDMVLACAGGAEALNPCSACHRASSGSLRRILIGLRARTAVAQCAPNQSLFGTATHPSTLYAMANDFCKSTTSSKGKPVPLSATLTATPDLSFILRKLSFSGDLWYNRSGPLGLEDATVCARQEWFSGSTPRGPIRLLGNSRSRE